MKKWVVEKNDAKMLREYPLFSNTEGWFIRITDVANGCWRAEASDRFGRVVGKDGENDDTERLLGEIEALITELNRDR